MAMAANTTTRLWQFLPLDLMEKCIGLRAHTVMKCQDLMTLTIWCCKMALSEITQEGRRILIRPDITK